MSKKFPKFLYTLTNLQSQDLCEPRLELLGQDPAFGQLQSLQSLGHLIARRCLGNLPDEVHGGAPERLLEPHLLMHTPLQQFLHVVG